MEWSNPRQAPHVPLQSRGELPHLYKPGGVYFVTFRLADAILPPSKRQFSAPPNTAPWDDDPDPHELLARYDPPLTLGSCWLGQPEIAKVVQNALLHFEGERYALGVWCVMPNHVHVIFAPEAGHHPADILKSWKGFTAREANRLLNRRGTFWERESFDHLIRSIRSLEKLGNYIEMNPVEAGLCNRPEDWAYSSAGVGFASTFWRR